MSEATTSQNEVFEFLGNPETHGGQEVRRIDTHGATVFLAGERAYKVKRAVSFPYLDYSTLAKRRAACEAELEVNRQFAPDIYLRAVPIARSASGALSIGGDGEPVEWAVEMERFDENDTLDHVADREGISNSVADQLGAVIAAFHRIAPAASTDDWLAALDKYLANNASIFHDHPALFEPARASELDRRMRASLDALRPLLQERGRLGFVRRGHGDLHLGNVVLLDGRPVPFDAIEFDPIVASGDVLYDLAFLLMDLIARDLGRAANIVLNRYLTDTGRIEHFDGLAALPFFLSLRAAIRAIVTCARLERPDVGERAKVEGDARRYFHLAGELLSAPPARLIAIGGLSGTGKSVLARSLAPDVPPAPGAVVLRSDVERKLMFGRAETDRLPKEAYEPSVSARVYRQLGIKAARVVAAGHSAIVDAVFDRFEDRSAIAAAAAEAGVPFQGLFLTVDLETRLARVGSRTADASDADAAVARSQEAAAIGSIDWSIVDASGTPDDTLARARTAIGHIRADQ